MNYILQNNECSEYKGIKKCLTCTKGEGDECLLRGHRRVSRDGEGRLITGESDTGSMGTFDGGVPSLLSTLFKYRDEFTMALPLEEHIVRLRQGVGPVLRQRLQRVEKHISQNRGSLCHFKVDPGETERCDKCQQDLFLASWCCLRCGQQCCIGCLPQLDQVNLDGLNFECVRERAHDFKPVSRIGDDELAELLEELSSNLYPDSGPLFTPEEDDADDRDNMETDKEDDAKSKIMRAYGAGGYRTAEAAHLRIPASAFQYNDVDGGQDYDKSRATEKKRREIFTQGVPVVIPRSEYDGNDSAFTPDRILHAVMSKMEERTGMMEDDALGDPANHLVVTTMAGAPVADVNAEEFFEQFTAEGEGREFYRARDFPLDESLLEAYPKIHEAVMSDIPIQTKNDGILNMMAHFATNATPPDVGPKFFMACGAMREDGVFVSTTPLHMDSADAVNTMVWSVDRIQGLPGHGSEWIIFDRRDASKIREYIIADANKQVDWQPMAEEDELKFDAIHSNNQRRFYFDDDALANLYKTKRVSHFRIHQAPGESVYVPPGCPHQVANTEYTIKIAADFVAVDSLKILYGIQNEFQAIGRGDVLRLDWALLHCWFSCRHLIAQTERDNEAMQVEQ